MNRIIAFMIVFTALAGYWYYEENFDNSTICESYNQETLSKKIQKNSNKSVTYANKWRNSCNADLKKHQNLKDKTDTDLYCQKIDKAAISTLAYVSVVKKQADGNKKAEEALNDTIKNISQYPYCIQYDIFNDMLNRSLKTVK
ncbi:MAG: hypothetical protein ACLSWI_08910 [Candidatus Gastranaerophilaceae bacterium]